MWRPSDEETRLVRGFAETQTTKKILKVSALGAALIGLVTLPLGLLFWVLAVVLGVVVTRLTRKLEEIRARVSKLRDFPNPDELEPGSLVSLIPDPLGLSLDRLVGRIGSASRTGGEAEIVSKPLGGNAWISKNTGSFSVEKGDWIQFHREDDGGWTIFAEAPLVHGDSDVDESSGDETAKKMKQLRQMNRTQARAIGALDDLERAQEELLGGDSNDADANSSSTSDSDLEECNGDAGTVWTKEEIIEHFDISEEQFAAKYQSYALTLRFSEKSSDWNSDVDNFARSRGALTEREIAIARNNFHQAVLNRVKLAFTVDGTR